MKAIIPVGRSKKPLQASISSTHLNSTEHYIESRKQSDITRQIPDAEKLRVGISQRPSYKRKPTHQRTTTKILCPSVFPIATIASILVRIELRTEFHVQYVFPELQHIHKVEFGMVPKSP